MNMPEIHPAVEAGNIEARVAKSRRQAVDDALEACARINARREAVAASLARKAARRVATKQLLIRAAVVFALVLSLGLADAFIDWRLVLTFQCAALVWLAAWFGAWLQFMFAKGGLLE